MSLDSIGSIASLHASPTLVAAAGAGGAAHAGRPRAEDVAKAAKQFEAILVRQLLAPSVEPMMNSQLGGGAGTGGGVYGYMLTDVLANAITQGGGLGLGRMFEMQLSPRTDVPSAPSDHE